MPKSEAQEQLKKLAVGHREREYERILTKGMENATDAQLIEDLLFYALPRIDTKPLARLLIGRFKTFARVVDAGERELTELTGMGKRSAAYLKLVGEGCRRYRLSAVSGMADLSRHSDVLRYVTAQLDGLEREQAHLFVLDKRYQLAEHAVLGVGSGDRVNIDMRELCETIIRAGCRHAVLAHNHPSGAVHPSLLDDQITENVLKAFALLGINLVDHVIVGYHSGCYSYWNSSDVFSGRLGLSASSGYQSMQDGAKFIYDTKEGG